jgi:hypothetical protein
MHVNGFQLPHVVGDSPLGPFTATSIAAPPTHFNPHAYHFDDGSATGIYVLYTNGGGFETAQERRRHNFREHFDAKAARTAQDCNKCCVACGGPKCCPGCPLCSSPGGTCNGNERDHKHAELPFVHPAGNCTTTLCAVYAKSLDGPWTMRNVDAKCTNNAVPYQLKNGSVLMAGKTKT